MSNYEIADHFSLLGKLLDIHGENSFKSKSYSSAAFTIEKLPKEVADMNEEELYKQRGIGQSVGEKIQELLQTGHMAALDELMAKTPEGVLEMLHIKGLGPKKINIIWKELSIADIGELEYACTENRLLPVKGFGAKTQDSICEAISFYRTNQGFHLWAHVEEDAQTLVAQLRKAIPQHRFDLTGAIRRQDEIVEAIEIVTDADADLLMRGYAGIEGVSFETMPASQLTIRVPSRPAIRFFLSDEKGYYKTLFRTSGSAEFYEAFTQRFTLPDHPESETEIFSEHSLPFIPAPIRETASIVELAAENRLPELIQASDIRGIIHSHSKWSDGANTIEEMARGAIAAGYEYLVISDHSQAAQYAGGLTPDRIIEQHKEIDALNKQLAPFRIFKSIEADILGDGALDYGPEVLKTFDLVIASVHSNLSMSQSKAMERVLAAVNNPFTTILGHPTGRLLLSRKGYPLDHKVLIDACAENGVVIEINAHPRRLDIDWRWVNYAMERGVLLSIDPDAHSIGGFRDVYYGVMIGQKGGLTREKNLSSFSLKEFEEFLTKTRQRKQVAA
jgi:DNA polymerase (family 10)